MSYRLASFFTPPHPHPVAATFPDTFCHPISLPFWLPDLSLTWTSQPPAHAHCVKHEHTRCWDPGVSTALELCASETGFFFASHPFAFWVALNFWDLLCFLGNLGNALLPFDVAPWLLPPAPTHTSSDEGCLLVLATLS